MENLLAQAYKDIRYVEEMNAIGKIFPEVLDSKLEKTITDLTDSIRNGKTQSLTPEIVAMIHNARGYAFMVRGGLNGNWESYFKCAIENFESSLREDTSYDAVFMTNLGRTLFGLEDYDRAEKMLKEAGTRLNELNGKTKERTKTRIRTYLSKIKEVNKDH
ncbi:tetratricopeptide repeat protein [Candidatus Woesearchaeota archaeon]|nr:tetratricopeptide repeat protein [Candidatus Woesearchaeota archaeon]